MSGPAQTITPLGCARAAFVGRTLRGPVNRPVFLTSFAEFQHTFGGLWQPSPLGYAVEHFFDNGGPGTIVAPAGHPARACPINLNTGPDSLELRAAGPGTRGVLRRSVELHHI